MSKTPDEKDHPYASRGGLKLEAALRAFELEITGDVAADLGCSTGGFTSCMLHHGAAKVYAVDTAYGELAWTLRQDERVEVMERSNALHVDPPAEALGAVDLVTIDLGWTRQAKALPAALRWLGPSGKIITLVKPHYEQPRDTNRSVSRKHGKVAKGPALSEEAAREICSRVCTAIDDDPALPLRVEGVIDSPIRGAKGGNLEMLVLLRRESV